LPGLLAQIACPDRPPRSFASIARQPPQRDPRYGAAMSRPNGTHHGFMIHSARGAAPLARPTDARRDAADGGVQAIARPRATAVSVLCVVAALSSVALLSAVGCGGVRGTARPLIAEQPAPAAANTPSGDSQQR
jgi:hypothetical protein